MTLQVEQLDRPRKHLEARDSPDAPTVAVGYDGSAASKAALAVARQRAQPSGTVVLVRMTAVTSNWLGMPAQDGADTDLRARAWITTGWTDIGANTLIVEPASTEATPAEALLRIAQACYASEIAVGYTPLGRFRVANGSLPAELLEIADRPVVVVPARPAREHASRRGL